MIAASDAPRINLSVIILARDEEANLAHALESLSGLGATVFVVDSGSIDRTCELAAEAGCTVVKHPFVNQADQLNWAIDSLPIQTEWVMRLDADERLTEELAAELPAALAGAPPGVSGFTLKRRVYFWGRWIRHGGYYPTWLFRIWRRGTARCEQRWMDEHMLSSAGRIDELGGDIIDENRKGLSFWVDKHNRYADREVLDLTSAEVGGGLGQQAGRRRWMKVNVYRRAPPFLRAIGYWFLRYFILLGFLDGLPGFVFHFNQGLWYRLLVDAKLRERALANQSSRRGATRP